MIYVSALSEGKRMNLDNAALDFVYTVADYF